MSVREVKERRKACNYTNSCERCDNCKHYKPSVFSQPAFGSLPPTPHKVETCLLHQFSVSKLGICDNWAEK